MSQTMCPRLRNSLFMQHLKCQVCCKGTTQYFSKSIINYNTICSGFLEKLPVKNKLSSSAYLCKTDSLAKPNGTKRKLKSKTLVKTIRNRHLELLKQDKLSYNKADKLESQSNCTATDGEKAKSMSDYELTRDLKLVNLLASAISGNGRRSLQTHITSWKTLPSVTIKNDDVSGFDIKPLDKCTNINKDAIYDEVPLKGGPNPQHPRDATTTQTGDSVKGSGQKAAGSKAEGDADQPKILDKLRNTLKKLFGRK